jgi:hypothetical protein
MSTDFSAIQTHLPHKTDCLRGIRRLHSEELRDSYFAPNIRVIKLRRRWAGHVECMGMTRDAYRFWWAYLRKRDHLEDLGVDRRIILKRIFKVG